MVNMDIPSVLTTADEAVLVQRIGSGDGFALEELMRRRHGHVFATCMGVLHNREDAFDATQETFAAVWRSAAGFRGDSAPGTWIHRIALNESIDMLRRKRRAHLIDIDRAREPADKGAGDQLEAVELRETLQRAWARLTPALREILLLAYAQAMPLNEVARALGLPLGTVKSRSFRGRQQLATLLEGDVPAVQLAQPA